jgi:hypothetical protein
MTVLGSSFWFDIEDFPWSSALNRRVVIIPGHDPDVYESIKNKSFIFNGLSGLWDPLYLSQKTPKPNKSVSFFCLDTSQVV